MAKGDVGLPAPYPPCPSSYRLVNQQNLAQMRMGLYAGWLRLAPNWIVPGELMTTAPAQALTGA